MRYLSPLGLVLLLSSISFAQSGVDLMVRPFPQDTILEMRGEAFRLVDAEVKDSDDNDVKIGMYDLEGRYRLRPGHRVDPRIGFDFTQLNVAGTDFVPDNLTDTAIAFGMGVLDNNGWIGGASIGIGYAGENAFSDGNAWYGKFDLAIGKQLSEDQEIGIVLDYDGNRSVYRDIPLLGFVYRLRMYDKKLLLAAGFPYTSVEWRPDDHWTLELRWSIPDDVQLFANYKIGNGLGAFASLRQRIESYHWGEIPDGHDRLFFEQRRAEAGLSYEPIERLRAELAIGYAFKQEFSTGWNSNNDTDEVADITDEPYFRIGVQWQY